MWKDSKEISYSGPRSGVSMITEKSLKTVVTLIIAEARISDSGVYTCTPNLANASLPTANISVSVLLGDKTAQLSGKEYVKHSEPIYLLVHFILFKFV